MTSDVHVPLSTLVGATLRSAIGLTMTLGSMTVVVWIDDRAGLALGPFWRAVAHLACGVVGLIGAFTYLGGDRRRRLARSAAASRTLATVDDVGDPFVLYLRPFGEDATRARLTNPRQDGPIDVSNVPLIRQRTEEEQIADVFGLVGDVVAIGSPDDPSTVLGAHRVRLPEPGADWRVLVSSLIERARFVVVHLGTSDGTLWEIFTVLATLPPYRFVMLVPMNHTQYATFLEAADAYLERHRDDPTFAPLRGTTATELFPAWSLDHQLAPSSIVALIHHGADRTEHGMIGLRHFRVVGQDSIYFTLESLVRPFLRRMLGREQETGPRIEDRAAWISRWQVSLLWWVIPQAVVLVALVVVCGLLTGFLDGYPFVLLAAVAVVGLSLGAGTRARAWPAAGPARARREQQVVWLVLTEALAVAAFFYRDVPVSLAAAGAAGIAACYVGLSVASFRRLVDLLLATATGVLAGLAHREVVELIVPGAAFAATLQPITTVAVCVGVMASLHSADRTRLGERSGAFDGVLTATVLSLGVLTALGVLPPTVPPTPAHLVGALLAVAVLAAARRVLIRVRAAE